MTTNYKYPVPMLDVAIEEPVRIPDEVTATAFEDFTLKTVEEIVKVRANPDSFRALFFYNGDHWQSGQGWIGPELPNDHKLFNETMAQIRRTFISRNVIAEVTDRHVSGVLGRDLHWKLVDKNPIPPVEEPDPITGETISKPGQPKPEVQALIQEAQMALVSWWDKREILETLKRAVAGLLCIERSPLRLSIPPTIRDDQGLIPQAPSLEEALDYIYLDHMGWDEETLDQVMPTSTVWANKNSRQSVGVFLYKEVLLDAETRKATAQDRAEVCYVDNAKNTILRIVNAEGDVTEPVSLPLGGRNLYHEMVRKSVISPQLMSQQKSLNKTLTMKDRNDTQGGYLERFLFNVKWPTKTITNSDGTVEEVPEPMYSGPGTVNSFQGSSYVDENGNTHVLPPSVQFRDPVPATTFIESGNATYVGMLSEANQLHHASTDADISGESRKQARESYIKDLQTTANVVEGAVRWILETALAEAAFLSGNVGRYDGLRAYAQCKIDPGPVSPDDMRVAGEMMDKGLWDWETAVSATGVDDVDGIKERLKVERAANEGRALASQQVQQDLFGEEEDEEDEPVTA